MNWFESMDGGPWHLINDLPVVSVEFIPTIEATGGWCPTCALPSVVTVHLYPFIRGGGSLSGEPFTAYACTTNPDHHPTKDTI